MKDVGLKEKVRRDEKACKGEGVSKRECGSDGKDNGGERKRWQKKGSRRDGKGHEGVCV